MWVPNSFFPLTLCICLLWCFSEMQPSQKARNTCKGTMLNCKIYLTVTIIISIFAIHNAEDYLSSQYKTNSREETENILKKNWFLQMLYEKTEMIKNQNCSLDVVYYLQGIENLTPWALKMVDATAKFPSGILDGNLRQYGHYDQCLSVKVMPNELKEKQDIFEGSHSQFQGLYCLLRLNFDLENSTSLNDDKEKRSLLHKINFILDAMMLERRELENREKERESMEHMPVIPIFSLSQWAVCLPSTCQTKDIEVYLNSVLATVLSQIQTLPLKVTLQVDREACVTYPMEEPSPNGLFKADNSFLYTATFLLLILIVGTSYDLRKSTTVTTDKSALTNVLLAFSIPANWKKMMGSGGPSRPASPSSQISTTLDCVDGVRVFSTIWVTLTHKVLLLTQEPFFNKDHLKESLSSLFWVPLTANMMSVDSFFLIGGLLRSYNYARDLDQGKSNQVSSLIQRYLRLTPAFAVMMWFYASTLHHLYDGPEWNWYVTSASKDCREHWLLNLLYIHNYIGFPRLCMMQSWYLAADMQLFIVAPMFVYPIWITFTKKKGIMRYIGGLPLITAILICMAIQYVITYTQGYPALYRVGSEDHILLRYVQYIHMATHTRMGPYLVGLLIGFMLNHYRGKHVTIPKLGVYLGWISSFLLFMYVLYGPYSTLQLGSPLKPLPDSIYAATHRTFWGIALGWVVFACCKGHGGPVNKLLSGKILHQLSSLSYCMFLTHVAILLTNLGTIRTSDYKDQYRLVRDFIADVAITIIFSTILYLAVEAPFSAITSVILKKGQKTEKKQLLTVDQAKISKNQ